VWNASIASALGANTKNNFCWGGSTAIRRETFEKIGMREKWRGTLSDDFAVTRAMKEADLPIYFVPNCLTATVEDGGFRELFEFTTRQMKITRVYAPHLWKASFIGSFLFSLIFWTGILLLFFISGWHFGVTFLLLSVIFALGAAKAWIRFNAVKLVLKNYAKELNKSFFWQITLWIFSSLLYFYNGFCAWQSNVIRWRGITYRLESPNKTVILENNK
jgi:cellulose synthase/poly-beta-1,6-N-acetylglucosamine synthase-like glycosyltransferase